MWKTLFSKLKSIDYLLLILCSALTVIGIISIYSADESTAVHQFHGFLGGLAIAVIVAFFDYHFILRFRWIYYIANIVLLVLVLTIGVSSHNAQRWLNIGGFQFQPAELAKLLLILFYASFIMKNSERIKNVFFDLICLGLVIPPIFLVYRQPDLSTSIMLATIFVCVMFIGGISSGLVAAMSAAAMVGVPVVFYLALMPDSPIVRPFQQRRILAWLHPEEYAMTEAYQTMNSLMAIGSGQLHGKGFDTNEMSSVLSGGYISESQTDFIFTIIGEEFGFIGACSVILLILGIAIDCLIIASRANDLGGKLIPTGMAVWIGFQGFLNIGVATGVMPNTGIPLPFVSSGLTSLWSIYAGIGCVLSVRMRQDDPHWAVYQREELYDMRM
ncbi:MAG: rod shape-determining protein RodA [Lachnospiraceae bacterium]|nr:rod shape-determining protein RodA [Lachnospiraceae bacterium]